MDLWIYLIVFMLIIISIPLAFTLSMAIAAQRKVAKDEEKRAETEAMAARAVPAEATIVSARTTSTRPSDGMNLVRITLSVQPREGKEYVAIQTWEVESGSVHLLKGGESIAVKIDPDNPKRVFPNVHWAHLWPWD